MPVAPASADVAHKLAECVDLQPLQRGAHRGRQPNRDGRVLTGAVGEGGLKVVECFHLALDHGGAADLVALLDRDLDLVVGEVLLEALG